MAFWPLSESSVGSGAVSRADLVGANTLTDNNTVPSAAGLVYANAASFTAANSENLSVASNANLQGGDVAFWVAAWVRAPAWVNNTVIVGKWGATREWLCFYFSGNLDFRVRNVADSASVAATVAYSAVNTWTLCVGYHDPTADVVALSVNGGAFVTTALTGGTCTATDAVSIGAYNNSLGHITARIGPVMFGKGYVPTADDVTWLYNGGAGRAL